MAGLYAGSSTLYTMSCWHSTGTVASKNSTKDDRLNQSLILARKLQQGFLNDGQIAIPSRDINDDDCIEIVVWYKTIHRPQTFKDIPSFLDKAAKDLNLTYTDFEEEDDQMTCSFTETEVNNILSCFKDSGIAPGGVTDTAAIKDIMRGQQDCLKRYHSPLKTGAKLHTGMGAAALPLRTGKPKALAAKAAEAARAAGVTEIVEDVTAVVAEPIWLSMTNINKLRMSRGDRLKSEFSAISDAVRDIAAATKTGWATFLMVAKGVVTVGAYVQEYVAASVNLESLEAISVCCSAIGVVGIAAILASVIAIITAIVVLLKDCINILVVINNTSADVTFTGDEVIYGERDSTTDKLPKRGTDFAYAAFFTYRKFHVGELALGLHGSLFGATFSFGDNSSFSVGMDCPLTIFGGTNSIRVIAGTGTEKAAWLAGGSGNEDDKAVSTDNTRSASARRALGLGNVNWAHLIFDDITIGN